ncbi:MAG TPA: glycosyltransferase [Candidatus Krumholzibacteria bacterium]|nr:glycosyltransferase [Candidatus Krumholzibacteria bacterium]
MVEPRDSDSPVPLVHVVQNLAIGGLERVVLNLATHAHRERYRTAIVCLGAGGPLVEQARDAGVGVSVLAQGSGFRPGTVLGLARAFRAQRVGVVHCHNAAPLVYGALAARMSGAAVVYTAHGMKTSGARQPVRLARLGLVDEFVTVSEDARRIATETAGVDPARVRTIWNGVDTAAYRRIEGEARARVRRSLGLPEDAFVFAIVARLSAAKDHANLFRAFAALTTSDANARLVVVGDGELRGSLGELVRELKMEQRIHMVGARDDVAAIAGAFDCFVLSSYTEGLAMTLLEAMAAELPVVATRVGGNAEVVVDGETGRLVPARDSDRLRDAMQWMSDHREAARAMGAKGRARAQSRFSVEAMVAAYEDAYRRALARRGHGHR